MLAELCEAADVDLQASRKQIMNYGRCASSRRRGVPLINRCSPITDEIAKNATLLSPAHFSDSESDHDHQEKKCVTKRIPEGLRLGSASDWALA